jgi:hypothetical protein
MRHHKSVTIACLLLMAATFGPGHAAAPNDVRIGVAPYVTCDAPDQIGVMISNPGRRSVELDTGSLPWHSSSPVLRLRAFSARADGSVTELMLVGLVGDHWNTTTLGAHSTLSGTVRLEHAFALNGKDLADGTVTVFYEVREWRNFSGGRGVIVFPRKRMFGRDCPYLIRSMPELKRTRGS